MKTDSRVFRDIGIWCLLLICVCGWLGFFTDGFFDNFLGHPYGDMPDHVWGNEWFAHSLRAGRWPWWVEHNYFPDGGVLWHIDPLGGFVRRLLLFIPAQWGWNLYLAGLVWLFSVTVYHWAKDSGLTIVEALGLALLAIVNPYLNGLIHSGLTEYMGLGFGVLLLRSLGDRCYWKAGIWLMVLGCQSFVVGLIGVLYVSIVLSLEEGIGRSSWKYWFRVAFPSVLFVLPWGWLCWQTLQHPDTAFQMVEAPGWNFRMLPTVDIFGYFPIGDWVHPDTRTMNPGIVQNHSLGWGWWVLLCYGLYKTWQEKALNSMRGIGIFSLLALGPRFSFLRWMPLGGWVLLPMALLYVPYSPFRWIHHPYHMVMFVWIGTVPLVFRYISSAPKWLWLLVFGLTGLETKSGSVPYPLVRTDFIEDVSLEGARLDFPPDQSTANRQYLIQQLRHGESIAYGVNRWLPDSVWKDAGVQRWVQLLDDPIRRTQNRDQPPQRLRFTNTTGKQQLDTLGFSWLVVHLNFLSDSEEQRLYPQLQRELGAPVIQSDTVWVYSVLPEPKL